MSYQALYRVWRPQTFDEMVGQPVIRETLKNAIQSGQISHAYLFTGPRGTGKTSAAKIVAKAINCPNQHDGNPCNQCEMCQLITDGQLSDVTEIDAASNNGVDEIRDLRENVRYAASEAQYKVYIIDEVHMLTTGAFNALLKTLEEPPERVIFILATTEPHKIPATIISRTQRFDFQRIVTQDLIHRMEEILEHDDIKYEDEALSIIARAANGGMRDSLSFLDQALAFNPEAVTITSALEVSGSFSQLELIDYIQAVYQLQSEEALQIVQKQLQAGKQASRFIEELILFSRDMLLTHHIERNQTLLSDEEIKPLLEEVPSEFYYQVIDLLNETQDKMRFSNQPELFVEVMTIQLAQGPKQPVSETKAPAAVGNTEVQSLKGTINQLEQRLAYLSQQVEDHQQKLEQKSFSSDKVSVSPMNEDTNAEEPEQEEPIVPRKRPAKQQNIYQLDLNQVHRVLNQATHQHIKQLKSVWPQVLQDISPIDRVKFTGTEVLAAGETMTLISFPNKVYCGDVQQNDSLCQFVETKVQEYMNQKLELVHIHSEEWPHIRKNYAILRKENNGQPIPVEEVKAEEQLSRAAVSDSQPQEEEIRETTESVQFDTPVSLGTHMQAVQGIDREDEAALAQLDNHNHAAETEEEGMPEIVRQAFEIFGEENVTVYED